MAMDTDTIPNLLGDLRDQAPDELQEYFIHFEDYWERKLWHELTDKLVEYFDQTASAQQRIPLFETFIKSFAKKINQLKLVQLGLKAASQFKDDTERFNFVSDIAKQVNKPASQDAYVYATVAAASIQLRTGDDEGARKKLDESEQILEGFDSVETAVHASFYKTSAEYYKAKHEFAAYYKNALLYLACVDLADLDLRERQSRAYDLSIAALVSDSIYNFGELLLHPILDSLVNTPHAWLRDLLFTFNRGDLTAYDVLAGNISKVPLLKEHQTFLYQKISLSALTETVFRRPPHDRAMTFQTISEETKVSPNEIEHLIMKALSLGLLKGTIDQVAEIARINWVQPKVLDMTQIQNMRGRLKEWDASVNHLGNWIEGVGKDVWAA
ncbi:26S proteasome regulatory subunit [Paraconiothyrium brasiliense]|uniref:26S proteasome regulatory subunit n=1 Tax=Paraconiothyrium brasiliense TaxID=300254 RepID=A0ABR3REY8_9PLEO